MDDQDEGNWSKTWRINVNDLPESSEEMRLVRLARERHKIKEDLDLYELTQRSRMDITLSDLFPGRLFRVTGAGIDRHGLRVQYEITPPLGEDDWIYVAWLLSGRDDVGTVYDSIGGASGLSRDGQSTTGIHSLGPPPVPEASWIDVVFHTPDARRTFRFRLPLSNEPPLEVPEPPLEAH
jgi:hypothetical protein